MNYYFGLLSVKVTVASSKITNVTIGAINDGGNSRSISIDQYSIPLLEQEALRAQSANIQSISGASYTSAGFAQSLQSALSKLGLK
ncbi:MAG: FMN-binding protein [Acidimicrobiales bacterium]